MKITMTVDCTPEEARAFMGFPNVAAMQDQMMGAMQEQFRQQMSSDPETAMKAWLGSGMQTMNEMQKAWGSFVKPPAKE